MKLQQGRPADTTNRLDKEIRTYELPDQTGSSILIPAFKIPIPSGIRISVQQHANPNASKMSASGSLMHTQTSARMRAPVR